MIIIVLYRYSIDQNCACISKNAPITVKVNLKLSICTSSSICNQKPKENLKNQEIIARIKSTRKRKKQHQILVFFRTNMEYNEIFGICLNSQWQNLEIFKYSRHSFAPSNLKLFVLFKYFIQRFRSKYRQPQASQSIIPCSSHTGF